MYAEAGKSRFPDGVAASASVLDLPIARAEVSAIERWFADAGVPPELDLARSGAPARTMAEILDAAGSKAAEEYLAMSLDYGPGTGSPRLRQAIAASSGVDVDDVLVTNGAIEALLLVCAATVEAGKAIAVATPGYEGLLRAAQASGAVVRPITVWRPGRQRLDLDETTKLELRHHTAIVLNSPHNPTGLRFDPDELADLARRCASAGTYLVIDQVSLGTLDPEGAEIWMAGLRQLANVVWVGDVSKALGLGGLRVGWCTTSSSVLRARIAALRDVSSLSNATPAQHLAALALEHQERLSVTETARANVTQLGALLASLEGSEWVPPVDGLVTFPRLPLPCPSLEFAARLRRRRGVLVAPGAFFGQDMHLRLGLGLARRLFRRAVDEVHEAVTSGLSR